MSKIELNRKYELVLILDAHLTGDQKESIYKEVVDVVKKSGGKVINSHVWFEKQKFTFAIKKRKEGTYYLINFEADGPSVDKMNTPLRLNEKILRFLITQVEAHSAVEAAHTAKQA